MNTYPLVHPLLFSQNPLITKLSHDPFWTVSDDKKRPVNAKILLDTYELYNAKLDDSREWPLVTLPELDADKNLDGVNRAYWLRARDNRVIAIDVEPIAPQWMKNQILNFPAHYTELSKNGGVHALILVPESLINEHNRYLFDDLSVFKEPVPKDENGKDIRPAFFEILLNDHYITFTKRMLVEKPSADYDDPTDREILQSFLTKILEMDQKRKADRDLVRQYQIGIVESQLNEDKQAEIRSFLELDIFDKAREKSIERKIHDFAGDESRYEMSVANGIAYYVIQNHKIAMDTEEKEIAESLTEKDLTYAIYLMLQDAVPHRAKHDQQRNGMPWLLFTSKRAYEFIKSKNEQRKKNKSTTQPKIT
ncbi:hypothetical protein ASD24_29580 [Paenibacillus sp. Root52]|uniref:hypothetical protein n=1 Tax=Paenibacillus sp. Root52 TaxID=1736552 RepID=UPI0006F728C0|nr:hypothetical protein [Paenibacillus sp. Root52]KQY83670.1 hypothetical protein ASD24_29580 [Paenibacillus sp. Root52]